MSNTTLTLAPTAVSGGAITAALTETLWIGSTRFLAVFVQAGGTAPGTYAQIIDVAADPYAGSSPTQTITTTFKITASAIKDPARLIRLDSNRVLMVSSTVQTTDFLQGSGNNTSAFDLNVLSIDGSNNITVSATLANAVSAGFMNYSAQSQPTLTRSVQATIGTISTTQEGFPALTAWSSPPLLVSADGAATNRVLIANRYLSQTGVVGSGTSSAVLYDIQFVVATNSLTVTSRYISTGFGYGTSTLTGTSGSYTRVLYGPNDFPWISKLSGTNLVLFGCQNYDATASLVGATTDQYRTATATSAFKNNNIAYTFDITQAGSTWTPSATISAARRASVMAPLDSDRMLEVTSQVLASGACNYARIYTISTSTWSGDMIVDASLATANKNGAVAFGLVNQITPLGNDRVLLSVTTRATTGSGAVGTPYFGVFKVVPGYTLTATGYGAPQANAVPYSLTFQRGDDLLKQRTVAQDPAGTSPNAAYDFVGRTSQTGWSFLRYTNPS